ncbi:MAG: NfeD family protein [Gammaproteobacteria bacterium]|nr:NfeD family protein [Gammaproteobacteria bacterium]
MEWASLVEFWHWWILAVVLIVLELFAPGAFFLWIGLSAGLVGALLWLIPGTTWEWQLTVFAVLSVVTVVGGRNFLRRHPIHTDAPELNRRGHHYVGRVFALNEPIVNGYGKIRVDDSTWKISGSDLPSGAKIQVVGVDGVVLKVVPATTVTTTTD